MGVAWSQEQVLGLAPDASSAASGKGLASERKWVSLGMADSVIWGECQGSGSKPYQTQVELSGPTFHCSCPSRKFPCKHGLGLMLLYAGGSSAMKPAEIPSRVSSWLEGREKRAEQKAAKEQEKQEKIERGEGLVDPAAKQKREDARLAKVTAGLDELGLWLADLARQGLAAAKGLPPSAWEERARRLIDAQAPGLARRVLQVVALPLNGEHGSSALLDRLGQVDLLIRAFRRLEALPSDVRDDVRAAVGFSADQDEVRTTEGARDVWMVIGRRVEVEDRLRVQRTWLLGRETGRRALLLDFTHVSQPRIDSGWPPGSTVDASLAFFPGTAPLRALVKEQHAPLGPLGEIEGLHGITEEVDAYLDHLARNPWLEHFPMAFSGASPRPGDAGWSVVDTRGRCLPLSPQFDDGWNLLAMSGGLPVTLVGEYDGSSLMPIAAVIDGQFRLIMTDQNEARPAVPPPVEGSSDLVQAWREVLASASVGVERKPIVVPGGESPLFEAARRLDGREPADRLFAIAALASAYSRGGRVPEHDASPALAPCEPDDQPECDQAPSLRLQMMLADSRSDFLPEWFRLLASKGKRVAAGDLVGVLDHGTRHVELRPAIIEAVGRRGRWLASLRKEWNYVGGEAVDSDPTAVWETGKKSERLVALRTLRASDPDRARELLGSTFASESAEDRATYLQTFEKGLSPTDEAFLETVLDDRSKPVRRAAAELLSRLPGSALCRRMTDRAEPLITIGTGKGSGPGGRNLEVNAPCDCPADWVRDGVEPKLTAEAKAEELGERAWWLSQVLAAVPPGHWVAELGWSPRLLIETASRTEWAKALLAGWTTATLRQGDADWSEALLARRWNAKGRTVDRAPELFGLLPSARREALVLEELRRDPQLFRHDALAIEYIPRLEGPLSLELARAILDPLRPGEKTPAKNWYKTYAMQQALGPLLPIELTEEVERLSAETLEPRHGLGYVLQELASQLRFRRDMHEEFHR